MTSFSTVLSPAVDELVLDLLDQPSSKFVKPTPRDWLVVGRQYITPPRQAPAWPHPASEAERLAELEGFLAEDFETFREVRIECQFLLGVPLSMRIDLLAVPKGLDVALAFEVKGKGFDVERSLKQCADYVGGRVVEGPHRGARIAACFLYPVAEFDDRGMFNLIAQWRVGRGFMVPYRTYSEGTQRDDHQLTLAFGYVVIWRSERGWTTKANDMLLGKRSVGGSRREF